jgi:signal transduction histidine kinase
MEFIAPLNSCPDAYEMVAYLQALAEQTRAHFAKELHDEMGGLLVSAVMDVAFAEQALPADDRLRQRLARARGTLAAAIDLKHRTIETLRPSILDNFGLFEAIRWEVKQESRRTHVPVSETYPAFEPSFLPDAAIALFRIAQESLGVALRQPAVKTIQVALDIGGDTLRIGVKHDGKTTDQMLSQDDIFLICSIAHRAHGLGGRMTVTAVTGGGAFYSTKLPLAQLVTSQSKSPARTPKKVSAE